VEEQLVALIARHGQTIANKTECFRGWIDFPLDDTGIKQAHDAQKFIHKFDLKYIICSPLCRATVTAEIIAKPHGIPVWQNSGLFPWRIGIFAGQPKEENNDALRLFVDNPYVRIPGGGESLDEYEERQFSFWKPALEGARKTGLTLFVAHTSNVTALVNFTEGAHEIEPEFGDSVKPGGVGAIYWDGKKHRVEPVFGGEEEACFGGS